QRPMCHPPYRLGGRSRPGRRCRRTAPRRASSPGRNASPRAAGARRRGRSLQRTVPPHRPADEGHAHQPRVPSTRPRRMEAPPPRQPPTPPPPPRPTPPELKTILERASRGDLTAMPELKKAFDERPELAALFGDLVRDAEEAVLNLAAGSYLVSREAIARQ